MSDHEIDDDEYYYDYDYESNADLILCKWFDAGTSSLEILFTSDNIIAEEGVKILTACVAIKAQFANRLKWTERQLTSSGDCSNGTLNRLYKTLTHS